jgi:hypothetical protein
MIQNINHQKQYEIIKLQQIAEENIKINRLKNEITAKINELCKTKVSKETREKKIEEILNYINENSKIWINM